MSHNLFENRMMYTGEKPWHGLGTELKNPATAKEAILAARLNYSIELQRVFTQDGKEIFGRRATVVTNTKIPLGIVSEAYKIVQNTEAFDFFDSVVGEGKAIYNTAGALGQGERIWILAKLPKNCVIKKVDEVEKYLLLTNSHDGKSSLRMYFTPIRVVCQNTLNMSLKDAADGIAIRHTGDIKLKISEAQRALNIATVFYSDFEKVSERMAAKSLKKEDATLYFSQVLKIEDDTKEEDVSSRKKNQVNDLLTLWERGKGNDNPAIRHTVWTAFNAVAEYTDHFRTVKGLVDDKTRKLDSIWFGSGFKMKDRAYQGALALIN